MGKNLEVNFRSRSEKGAEVWEGTVNVPGVRPTKLVSRSTNSTSFASKSAVSAAAKRFAKEIGYSDTAQTTKTVVKKTTKKTNLKLANA